MKGIILQVREVRKDGLPAEDLVRAGRVMIGGDGSLHTARVHRTMDNPYHPDVAVWQQADGRYRYNIQVWVELSEPIPGNALA